MRNIGIVSVTLLVLAAIVAATGFIWWGRVQGPPTNTEEEKRFVITKGSSVEKIGTQLEEAGLIKSGFAFKLYVQIRGLTNDVPPGEFRIAQNLSLTKVLAVLKEGPVELWVTIPEGLRREQLPQRFIDALELDTTAADLFSSEFLEVSVGDEGYLFPDTYLVPRDITGSEAVNLMVDTFSEVFRVTGSETLSLDEIVVLASIIERETITDEERPIVAGVYLNRLDIGMPLQADATAQYAIGVPGNWWSKNITRQDLEINSPYNTYLINGLPPAPIASPGISSLNAAANPSETGFFYYIHDSDGVIHFAEDLTAHNRNIQKYLR